MADPHFRHPPFKVALEGFSFTLPCDWEIAGYLLDYPQEEGLLSFSREGTAMGQFSWRKVKAVPDIPRIIEEIHRRHMVMEETPKMRFTRHGRVQLAHTRSGERFYASVFNSSRMYLCEWIFPKYTKENADAVVSMLESYSDNAPDEKTGRQFYALFGLECSVPKEYHFVKPEPFPASVSMIFENRKHYTITARRFGMADVYMQGANVANFYHRCLYARRWAIRSVMTVSPVNGCDTCEIEFRARGKFGFDFLLGPWWHGFASAFYKPSENRVYAFEHLASPFYKEREKLKDIFQPKLADRG